VAREDLGGAGVGPGVLARAAGGGRPRRRAGGRGLQRGDVAPPGRVARKSAKLTSGSAAMVGVVVDSSGDPAVHTEGETRLSVTV
jgi:hypothetical protein